MNAARGKIMKILAIEASGQVCGTAVLEDDTLVADYNILYKKTHSQSLVPMMDEMKRMIDLDLETVDAIAVTKGPGSFTGIRIGAATAKGLALALNRPIIPVPTVESIAWNLCGTGSEQVICPIMDARRSQVYTGVYESSAELCAVCGENCGNGKGAAENCVKDQCAAAGCGRQTAWQMLTLKDQCVISIEEICAILNCIGSSVIFLGDGVPVYQEKIADLMRVPYSFAPAHLSKQRAGSTAALAMQFWREKGDACLVNADDFRPDYLRLSQAERDRAAGVDTSRTVHRD
jgi:tRNA threonylcarbamoyladenosine biosynthesis protein TsaB